MRYRLGKILMLGGLAALLGLEACKDCTPIPGTLHEVLVKVYSYDSLTLSGKKILLADTIVELGASGLAPAIYADTLLHTLALPLTGNEAALLFYWVRADESIDTVRLSYRAQAIPVPPDCGVYEAYDRLAVDVHTFDSVQVVKNDLTLRDEVHLEVFTEKR